MTENSKKMGLFPLIIGFLFAIDCQMVWAGDWVMSVQKENLAPFKYQNATGPAGIEVELASMVAAEVGEKLFFKELPIAAGRKEFENGTVTVDCCLNEVWFPSAAGKQAQLFSDPLYRLLEVWVFPKGKSFEFKSVKELSDKRVIGIKGFNYPGEEHYGTRIDGATPLEVMEKLIAGEADVAVLERHVASYLINTRNLKAEFGNLYYAVDVSLRLHKSLKDYLPVINAAVDKLKTTGYVDDVIKRNLRKN